MTENMKEEKGIVPVVVALVILVAIIIGVVYSSRPKTDTTPVDSKITLDEKMEDGVMTAQLSPTPFIRMLTDAEVDEMRPGSYEAYTPSKIAWAATGKVVLFFRASWCPTCKALDAYLKANISKIPKGVTILDVDYDTAMALRVQYGVTVQHTLVQVDKKGNLLSKWSGSPDISDISSHLK